MAIERFLYVNEGSDELKLNDFISKSIDYIVSNNYKNIVIYCPSKDLIRDGIIANILPDDMIRSLYKTNTYSTKNETFHLRSHKTTNSILSTDLVIAIHASDSDLDKIDSIIDCKAICCISWLLKDAKRWFFTWSPTIWGDATINVSDLDLPDLVIQKLLLLSNKINLNSGLMHATDKQAAKDIFENLKRQKIIVSKGSIKYWAIGHKWKPEYADDLEKMAERYIQ